MAVAAIHRRTEVTRDLTTTSAPAMAVLLDEAFDWALLQSFIRLLRRVDLGIIENLAERPELEA